MCTTLFFIRHGQSEANTEKYFAGHYDAPLTSLGHQQAEKMASFLKKYPISAIYSSDLSRAISTALPIASLFGLSVIPEKRLREVHAGEWQRMPFTFLEKNETYLNWRTGQLDIRPNGGEAIKDLFLRVSAAVSDIVAAHPGESVAVVTHATPIRVMKTDWLSAPISELLSISSPPNASVTAVTYKADGKKEIILDGENQFLGELSKAETTQM